MRLIDADKLIEVLNKKSVSFNANVNDAILTAPTVDAVPYEEWFSTNCETCKEYDKEKHCCPKFRGVIKQALKDFEENNKIVRCKDCKFGVYEKGRGIYHTRCEILEFLFQDDDYCSYGERKEE